MKKLPPTKTAISVEKPETDKSIAVIDKSDSAPHCAPKFVIVALGASAGGLEAFETFFKALPNNTGIAFVLIAHLDPTHVSLLPELLQKRTQMPVHKISDGMRVQPNNVYVIPPNYNLGILNGVLQLMKIVKPRGANLPIDSFFRSLAQDQGSNAVCIILSGTGTDGTLGLRAIKGEVGMVMVQDQESAKYDGMPSSAISTGLADYVLSPEIMPEQLIKYTDNLLHLGTPLSSPGGSGNTALNALQKIYLILRTQTDHDFSLYKKNTICRRIERRMTVNQINEIDDYVRYLQESEREAAILFKELLIGVTNFFRDPIIFASLSELLVRKLLVGKPHQYTLRVWVAGCSSGEEAYSIAIILQECMQQLDRHFNVQIFATDIDEEAISVARQGIYPESIQADVSPERLSRYFTKENDGRYRIHKTTREMLVFAPQNLTKDPPFTNLDLLCCRNLLIYLGPELQKKLLQVFHYSLRKGGMLFLGSSETIGQGGTELFSALDKKGKIFRRKPSTTPAHSDLTFPAVPTTISVESLLIPEQIRQAEEISALQLVESILKQSNTSPCVIIDDQSNIVYIHGQTGRFLEPAEGKISVNILKMARLGLRVVLAAAIRKVATHKQEVTHRGLEMESEGKTIHLDLVVRPILEQSVMRGMMMIIFEDSNKAKKNKKSPPTPQRIESLNKTAKELSLELDYTKENLQTTIEELETTNEELKSTNEELQSTNEELQSTNEEMETSKEELQSLNEESVTVNSELQSRIDELSIANDDMKNLLDSTDIATVFLDTNLCIRRFTPSATEIIPLAGSDSGRPIKHFATILIDTDLTEYGRLVLQDLEVREAEVKSRDGRFFFMRVRPYRTTNNVIDGVIVTFEDISIRMKDEQSIKEVVGRYKILFDMVGDSIVVVDLETGRFKESNKQARTRLGYTKKEFEQLSIADIETADSPLKEMQHMAKAGKKRNNTYETRHKAKDGTITDVVVKAMAIKFGDKKHLLCTWNDMPENSTTME